MLSLPDPATRQLCLDAWTIAALTTDPLGYLTDELGADLARTVNNVVALYFRSIAKDTPAKRWFELPAGHPSVSRALRLSHDDPARPYATLPFRLARSEEGKPVIHVAWPCPNYLNPNHDWLDIVDVVEWDPVANTVGIVGDPGAKMTGAFDQTKDEGAIYGDPRAFFQDWARNRAVFQAHRRLALQNHWNAAPVERDEAPGVLLLAQPEAVAWPAHAMPETIHAIGVDPARLNRAILKSARLPRAVNQARAAA